MRDSSRGRGYHALCQGPTFGPQAAEKELGLRECVRTKFDRYQSRRAEFSPGLRPINANLFGMFFAKTHHKIVILSGAPHRFVA